MKTAIILALLFGLVFSNQIHHDLMNLFMQKSPKESFKLWHYANNRPYDLNSEVALQKYKAFKANYNMIKNHDSVKEGFTIGLTAFSDLTWEEIEKSYLHPDPIIEEKEKNLSFDELADQDDLNDNGSVSQPNVHPHPPESPHDWTHLYSHVKDQGQCGGCWAFSVAGTIEGYVKKNLNKRVLLSEQQLIDCRRDTFMRGCDGGVTSVGFDYVKEHGLAEWKDYPYEMRDDQQCRPFKPIVGIKGTYYCKYKSQYSTCTDSVILDVLSKGPYSGGVRTSVKYFHYTGGIYRYDGICDGSNHAIIVLGLKRDHVWIRNSYGRNWGYNGNAKICRDCDGPEGDGCSTLANVVIPQDVYFYN